MQIKPLNIFYQEPDPDRWIKYDHYPRKFIRRIFRGKHKPGGVMMVALHLMKGFDKIGIPYRFNDFAYIKKHPEEIACIIGKPQVLDKFKWKNPIIFGAGIFSHPIDCPNLLSLYPGIKKIVVPGKWMKKAFDPFFGEDKVVSWPVGIDTDQWSMALKTSELSTDFLIYDKVRWLHDEFEKSLIHPIRTILSDKGLSFEKIRYGHYNHAELKDKLSRCKAVIFLCEHETQGLAYQQILATGTPILAWDRGGFWQDPHYFPDKVKFSPVSAVPYWNNQCGLKFNGIDDFESALNTFIIENKNNTFAPRSFILENLTLEICAKKYLDIFNAVNP
ncbi:hypothetical protein [Pedobacter miscanthi]|uniref:glycosyltransferase n=1 Tax=Pedobacter miscanthi TaxID=2259170 RepID=UPI00292F3A75|nr:hypothetical protein [Pedobacter miscanthi]